MTHAVFTRPDGQPRVINSDDVADISPAPPGVYAPQAKTVITEASGATAEVTEDFETVCRKLGWS